MVVSLIYYIEKFWSSWLWNEPDNLCLTKASSSSASGSSLMGSALLTHGEALPMAVLFSLIGICAFYLLDDDHFLWCFSEHILISCVLSFRSCLHTIQQAILESFLFYFAFFFFFNNQKVSSSFIKCHFPAFKYLYISVQGTGFNFSFG